MRQIDSALSESAPLIKLAKEKKQSGGDLDRLSDKFIKGENHSERHSAATNPPSPHADRGSQTHSGLPSTSRQRQVVGLKKEKKTHQDEREESAERLGFAL